MTIVVAVAGGALGCSQGQAEDNTKTTAVNQAIIHGTDASDSKFDAIGALLTVGDWDFACSGTLIALK